MLVNYLSSTPTFESFATLDTLGESHRYDGVYGVSGVFGVRGVCWFLATSGDGLLAICWRCRASLWSEQRAVGVSALSVTKWVTSLARKNSMDCEEAKYEKYSKPYASLNIK